MTLLHTQTGIPVARDAALILRPRPRSAAAKVNVPQGPRDKRQKGASAPAPESEEFDVRGGRFERRCAWRVVGEEGATDGTEEWGEGGGVEDVVLDYGVGDEPVRMGKRGVSRSVEAEIGLEMSSPAGRGSGCNRALESNQHLLCLDTMAPCLVWLADMDMT